MLPDTVDTCRVTVKLSGADTKLSTVTNEKLVHILTSKYIGIKSALPQSFLVPVEDLQWASVTVPEPFSIYQQCLRALMGHRQAKQGSSLCSHKGNQ